MRFVPFRHSRRPTAEAALDLAAKSGLILSIGLTIFAWIGLARVPEGRVSPKPGPSGARVRVADRVPGVEQAGTIVACPGS